MSPAVLRCIDRIFVFGERHPNIPFFGRALGWCFCARAVGIAAHAIENRDYLRAFALLERIGRLEYEDKASSEAKFLMAKLYWNGWGLDSDRRKAVMLFEESASSGYFEAIDFMSRRNQYLRGGATDEEIALVA